MYAAAGGASLASRQARRKQKQHHTNENLHQQFHKRFQQLQHQHAPACAEGYHYMRTSSSGFLSPSHPPSFTDLQNRGNAPTDYSLHEQLLEGKSSVVWFDREKKGGLSPCSELVPPFITHHSHNKLRISYTQRKWNKKNKIYKNSFGANSSEDIHSGLHRQYDAAANMLLYIGLCAVALGLVIAFVGTGEKGFKTVQLRLIGPIMIGFGTFCCCLRIIFCFCPTKCMRKHFQHRYKNKTNSLSNATQLNRLGYTSNDRGHLHYYRHLPFRSQMSNNFLLFEETSSSLLKENKKVLITKKSDEIKVVKVRQQTNCMNNRDMAPDFVIDDAASDSLSTLRELSPLHEEDLIDFQPSSNSFENLPSFDSSLEYLNDSQSQKEIAAAPIVGGTNSVIHENVILGMNSEERMSRLKSTITFRDSIDFTDNQLMISYDEFDLQDDFKLLETKEDESGNNYFQAIGRVIEGNMRDVEESLLDLSNTSELVLSAETLQKQN